MDILSALILAFCFGNAICKMEIEDVQAESIRIKLRGMHWKSELGNEYGLEGESTWHCERMTKEETDEGHHSPANPVYFVQTQSKRYKHNVILENNSKPRSSPQTIYVIPPKTSHEIEVETVDQGAGVVKPKFFFLKSHPSESKDDGDDHSHKEEHNTRTQHSSSSSSKSSEPTAAVAPHSKELSLLHHRLSRRNKTSSSSSRKST